MFVSAEWCSFPLLASCLIFLLFFYAWYEQFKRGNALDSVDQNIISSTLYNNCVFCLGYHQYRSNCRVAPASVWNNHSHFGAAGGPKGLCISLFEVPCTTRVGVLGLLIFINRKYLFGGELEERPRSTTAVLPLSLKSDTSTRNGEINYFDSKSRYELAKSEINWTYFEFVSFF